MAKGLFKYYTIGAIDLIENIAELFDTCNVVVWSHYFNVRYWYINFSYGHIFLIIQR